MLGLEQFALGHDRGASQDHSRIIRHNVCRHRGSRLVAVAGGMRRRWGAEFCTAGYALAPVQVEEMAGLLFVSVAPDPPPFAAAADAVGPQLAPHRLEAAVRERLRRHPLARLPAGPVSPMVENSVDVFLDWYLARMGAEDL